MIPDGELAPAAVMPAAAPAVAPRALSWRIPIGAAPDAVRDWFELETIVDLPAPAASFAEAEAAAADYRRAARADNTRRAYRAAVARFTDWCAVHAPDRTAGRARDRRRVSRGRGGQGPRRQHPAAAPRRAALSASVGRLSAADRIADGVSATFAGIRRAHRRPLRKKTALVLDPLRAAVQAIPDTLPGRRDRALILVGFAAALRPSELARLDIAALTRHEDGIALFLPWRKNDQEAQGTTVWLPVGPDRSVPGPRPRSLARRGRNHRGAAVPAAVAAAAAARAQRRQAESR